MKYVIISGDEDSLFEIYGTSPTALHLKRKIQKPRTYDLEVLGFSTDPDYYEESRRDPFTLRLRLIISN